MPAGGPDSDASPALGGGPGSGPGSGPGGGPRGGRTGRRPGDSGTRAAIEAAARRQFSERGYDRTSVRSIAQEAGVDPALVSHYFGSKQRLFVGVVELPVQPEELLALVLAGGRERVGERLVRFIVGSLQDEHRLARMTGLVRAAAAEPGAAEMIREVIQERLLAPLATALDSDRPQLRGALAGSQIVGLVMARHIVGIGPLREATEEELVAALAPTVQRYLTGDVAAP